MIEKPACCAVNTPASSFFQKVLAYKPLLAAALFSAVLAAVLAVAGLGGWMPLAMGFFFCFLAFLKLIDVPGFAAGFAQYDVLAARVPAYARAYPFIEAAWGILYLSQFLPALTNISVLVFMIIGNVGVWRVIRSGRSVACVCVGAGFTVPVGRVTFVENGVMALMAGLNLFHIYSIL